MSLPANTPFVPLMHRQVGEPTDDIFDTVTHKNPALEYDIEVSSNDQYFKL